MSVFTDKQIRRYPLEAVCDVENPQAREALTSIGLPAWPQIWFKFPDPPHRPETLGDSSYYRRIVELGNGPIPPEALDWHVLATFSVNKIVLNTHTGEVHYIRPNEDDAYVLHRSLGSFIQFLCALKKNAPMTPDEDFEDFFELDLDLVRSTLQAEWREIEPYALRRKSSVWYEVLLILHDPEAWHGEDAESYPYPFFEEDVIAAHTAS
ncbi:SUKH-4 family immunity protein [Streptomyces sp. XM4193]|nr:SUKH-4 family immunity protein [Streptomyces sp. XM4193]